MDVSENELESLIAEALMQDRLFLPKRRNWAETREADLRRARICAAAIVSFLRACGLRWTRIAPPPPHRTPGS